MDQNHLLDYNRGRSPWCWSYLPRICISTFGVGSVLCVLVSTVHKLHGREETALSWL